jgi:uncharacterized protein (UPF0335 family)
LKGGGKRVTKKLLDFTGAKISDVKQINPLFSTCKVRVLYTGKNRNMSIISKDAVEKALPSIIGVPIVGEFSMEAKDFKGHGGAIDLDSYDFIHTTKPYGFVPQDATFSWEEVKTRDGSIREYLTVDGCYLWTGRYPEAFSVVESGKGQSMEIEVNDGEWNDNEEAYDIKNFTFSALCILGDDVEPAFEDASVTASFSLDSDSFKLEYANMMEDVKKTLLQEKEVNGMLKELLEKYSLTVEDLTAKGINFSEISEDELEAKIVEVFEIDAQPEGEGEGEQNPEGEGEGQEPEGQEDPETQPEGGENTDPEGDEGDENPEQPEGEGQVDVEAFNLRIKELEDEKAELTTKVTDLTDEVNTLTTEVEGLRQFKLDIEKADHENKVATMFSNFQLSEEDVEGLDVHAFSLDEIEEKCYAILGKKLAKNSKNFSKNSKDEGIKLPLNNGKDENEQPENPYGDLFDKYNK